MFSSFISALFDNQWDIEVEYLFSSGIGTSLKLLLVLLKFYINWCLLGYSDDSVSYVEQAGQAPFYL